MTYRRPKVGDRVCVTGRMDDPRPLPVGATGVVYYVTPPEWLFQQYGVVWDGPHAHCKLLLLPSDSFVILRKQ